MRRNNYQTNRGSKEIRKILKRRIWEKVQRALQNWLNRIRFLFGMYITLYNEGSKFEHSDISTTKLYRKQAAEGYPTDQVFVFDLGKSNKEGWLKVFQYSQMSLFFCFLIAFVKRVKEREVNCLKQPLMERERIQRKILIEFS